MELTHYRRAFGYVLRYRARVAVLLSCVLIIGVLYSAGLSAMLPVLKIMISPEGLHGWVRRLRVEARLGASLDFAVSRSQPGLMVLSAGGGGSGGGSVGGSGGGGSDRGSGGQLAVGEEITAVNGRAIRHDDLEDELEALATWPSDWLIPLTVRGVSGAGSERTIHLSLPPEGRLLRNAGWLTDQLPEGGHDEKLISLCVVLWVLLSLSFWSAVARYVQEYLTELVASRAMLDLRCQAFDAVLRSRMSDLSTDGVHDVMGRFGNEYADLRDGLVQVLGRAFREPIKAVGVIVVAFWLDWTLTLAGVLVIPVVAVLIKRLGKRMQRAARKSLEADGTVRGVLQEALLGLRVVKAYTAEGHERAKFLSAGREYLRQVMKFKKSEALAEPLMEFLAGCGAAAVAIWAAHLVFSGQMAPEHFFAFLVCMVALADPARKLSSVMAKVRKADAAAKRIFELVDRPPELTAPAPPGTPASAESSTPAAPSESANVPASELANVPTSVPRAAPASVAVGPLRESLNFDGVWFAYPEREPVLRGLDLEVRAGETVAIVGPNGAGKTTLISLVERFFDPTGGAIRWDGVDLRRVPQRWLRGHIGLVTQDAVIFKDSVASNIAYGRPGSSEAEIAAAARRARADDFIVGLRDSDGRTGYAARLAEHGLSLSGGQRQRLALARAILRDPSLLILDEATSQIDAESESLIREALREFGKGRTTLVIAHRLSTVQSADRIAVLEAGRVSAVGRHEELLAGSERYQQFCQQQLHTAPSVGSAPLAAEPAAPAESSRETSRLAEAAEKG